MRQFFTVFFSALLYTSLALSPAHAVETLGDCYMHVEAYDQALGEESYDSTDTVEALQTMLGDVVSACEAGDFIKATDALAQAHTLYEHIISASSKEPTDAEFWRLADYWWGHGSHKKGVEFMRAPMSPDDIADIIGWRLNLDSPEGVFFEVVVVVKTPDGSIQHGYISLPYDSGKQYALCHIGEKYTAPTVSHKAWTQDELAELGVAAAPYSVVLEDGMCDKIYLFWPTEPQKDSEEVKLILFRN